MVAGVGTNSTAHSVELAQQAAKIGVDGLLLVTPYYNKPSQAGLLHHFRSVVESTDLPVMLYDVPGRTGTAIELETYAEAITWSPVVAVKDAVGDFARGVKLIQMGYAVYSGDDVANLGWLAHGAAGIVSVVGHAAGPQLSEMVGCLPLRRPRRSPRDLHATAPRDRRRHGRPQLRSHDREGCPAAARRDRQPQRPGAAGAADRRRGGRAARTASPPPD